MNTQTIELDIDKRGCGNNCIRIAQGEGGGTTIKALIYDNGGELSLSGYGAFLVARLPDRIHYYRGSATVSGNTITYVCDESKLASVPATPTKPISKSSRTISLHRRSDSPWTSCAAPKRVSSQRSLGTTRLTTLSGVEKTPPPRANRPSLTRAER